MLYAIREDDSGAVKLGWTGGTSVKQRLAELRTSTAHKLTVLKAWPGTLDDEAALHQRFAAKHIDNGPTAGTEWYALDAKDIEALGVGKWEPIDYIVGYGLPLAVMAAVQWWAWAHIIHWFLTLH